jgi:hypothetical protein
VLQRRTYEEAVSGRFITLADFEAPPGPLGPTEPFSIQGAGGRAAISTTRARTGAGALAVELAAGGRLVYRTGTQRDFSLYTLLSAAVYVSQPRDDMTITLVGPNGRWRSCDRLLTAGWNTVMVDVAHLQRTGALDVRDVRQVEISFGPGQPASFMLDDLLLIDNTRTISPTPAGMVLRRIGLDYELTLTGQGRTIRLAQGSDGLWRCAGGGTIIQLGTPAARLEGQAESIELMGQRRAGAMQLLEANPVRVRLASTWYFPPEMGLWRQLEVRQLRWEYTFYGDGRCVTSLRLSNPGGPDVSQVRLIAPFPAAWSDGTLGAELHAMGLNGQMDTWSWLTCPAASDTADLLADYAHPPAARIVLGRTVDRPSDTDAGSPVGADGFDAAQGCYVARAIGGHCRIELAVGSHSLHRPVFRIEGPWTGPVIASHAGMPIRPIIQTGRQAVAVLEEVLTEPALVEFSGPVERLEQ